MPLKSLSGRKLFEDVVTYAQMGEHRTATEADLRTASWIADRLSAAGFKTEFLKWRLRQFFIEKCELEVEAKTRECFPLWFPKATGAEPVRAPLVLFQEERETQAVRDKIVLVKFDQWFVAPESDHARLIKGLAKEGALAVLGYNPSLSGEVFVTNAFSPFSQESWPIPVALVGAKERVSLKNAARRHAMATLLVTGRDEAEAEARNVIGKLKRDESWIVVSTPQSGWFRCAGERGPGVALFLDLARWASELSFGPSWLFLSNSGHELGNMGLHHILERGELPPPDKVICWLHLGASIATWNWKHNGIFLEQNGISPRISLISSPEFIPALKRAFASMPSLTPKTGAARGELMGVLEKGYRSFGFFGDHHFFHTPADGPETTAPKLLEPVASALAASLESIIKNH